MDRDCLPLIYQICLKQVTQTPLQCDVQSFQVALYLLHIFVSKSVSQCMCRLQPTHTLMWAECDLNMRHLHYISYNIFHRYMYSIMTRFSSINHHLCNPLIIHSAEFTFAVISQAFFIYMVLTGLELGVEGRVGMCLGRNAGGHQHKHYLPSTPSPVASLLADLHLPNRHIDRPGCLGHPAGLSWLWLLILSDFIVFLVLPKLSAAVQ